MAALTIKRLMVAMCFLYTVIDLGMAVRLASTREWYTVDLLQHVSWTTPCTQQAVEPIPAHDKQTTAFLLKDGASRCLEVEESFVHGQLQTILSDAEELTVLVALKQQHNNSGSILAFSQHNKILFEVESNGQRDEMRLHYIHDHRTNVQVLPVHLADNQWHKLAVTFSHSFIHVFIDCQQVFERQVDSIDLSFIEEDNVRLWVTQRNNRHAQLKGAVEYVKIVTTPQGYLEQCPYADVACPTCNQFKNLENTVSELYSFVHELHGKLESAEKRLEEVESCECLQSCEVDGTRYRDGESWNLDYCTKCTCRGGSVECAQPNCPVPNCKNPVLMDGHCCPTCLKRCYAGGTYYEHGEGFQPEDRVCVDCTCGDGKMTCKHRTCPALDCPVGEQIEVQGECCKVCRNTNFCAAQNDCHANATCFNLESKYMCRCRNGFTGDGQHCEDIDECATVGGRFGHYCRGNSVCKNSVGSYDCHCIEGFVPNDPFTCKEFDACADSNAVCGDHAQCINQRTSYKCECLPGYQGDGTECQPICPEGCGNGGRCVSPGVCQCRKGFVGTNCQEDIDECALGLAQCSSTSRCVNLPGSFMCACKTGYHSSQDDNQNGWLCQDVDECRGFGDGHTCALGTQCRNTEGGYECICQDHWRCNRACTVGRSTVPHGNIFPSADDHCSTCKCDNGDVTCTRNACDCSSASVDMRCCEQCAAEHECTHQQLPITYKTGDKWMYYCQTCTCLNGHSECEQSQCPKLECSPAVQIEGDCCARCMEETDACSVQEKDIIRARTCMVDGRTYMYGQHFQLEKVDRCTTCTCKNGHICCSYNQTCLQLNMEFVRHSASNHKRALEARQASAQNQQYVFDYDRNAQVRVETSNEDFEDAYYDDRRDSRPSRPRRRKAKNLSDNAEVLTPIRSFDASQTLHDTGQYDQARNSGYQNDYSYNRQDNMGHAQRSGASQSNRDARHHRDRERRRARRDSVLRDSIRLQRR